MSDRVDEMPGGDAVSQPGEVRPGVGRGILPLPEDEELDIAHARFEGNLE